MDKIVALLFLARDWAHLEHLRTSSYAQHMALGSFYEEAINLADTLTEAWQGSYGLLNIELMSGKLPKDIIEALEAQQDWIESARKSLPTEDTDIQNIIDEVIALYRQTLYKLKFLK